MACKVPPDLNTSPFLFRVDSYDQIGLGHIKRCAALGHALKEQKQELVFVSNSDSSTIKSVLEPLESPVIYAENKINTEGDLESTLALAEQFKAKTILIDSYDIDQNYFQGFQNANMQIAYFEDFGRPDWPVDIVINGLIGAENLQYNSAEALLGTRYLVLGKEYWKTDTNLEQASNSIEVMITVGGIDHYDLMSRSLDLLGKLNFPIKVHCIIGPYFENQENISAAIERSPHTVKIHNQPDSLASLIKESHFAISAGGMTLYELASNGVPTIGISLWENQTLNVEHLGDAGVIVPLNYFKGAEFDLALEDAIVNLFGNQEKMDSLQTAGRALIDGQGARRVAESIIEIQE